MSENYTLHLGDCLDVLRTMPDASLDAVITDPPYGIDYQSGHRPDARRFEKIANDGQPYVWWLPEAARLLRPGGCLLCFCRWDVAEAFRLAIGWSGLQVGAQLIWDRGNHGLGDLKGRPAPRHDTIWFAVKGKFRFHGDRPHSIVGGMRLSGGELLHPNQKPIETMRELVKDYVPPGGLVLDPFAGSGSTGVAALSIGRRFVGCEIDPKYHAVALRRLAEVECEGGLFSQRQLLEG